MSGSNSVIVTADGVATGHMNSQAVRPTAPIDRNIQITNPARSAPTPPPGAPSAPRFDEDQVALMDGSFARAYTAPDGRQIVNVGGMELELGVAIGMGLIQTGAINPNANAPADTKAKSDTAKTEAKTDDAADAAAELSAQDHADYKFTVEGLEQRMADVGLDAVHFADISLTSQGDWSPEALAMLEKSVGKEQAAEIVNVIEEYVGANILHLARQANISDLNAFSDALMTHPDYRHCAIALARGSTAPMRTLIGSLRGR